MHSIAQPWCARIKCTLYNHIYIYYTYTYICIFVFHVRLVCNAYHVRSTSDRGKGQMAISGIPEKGTDHFLRICDFKPNAKRTQNIFNMRFERIKLIRRVRLTRSKDEKLVGVERNPNQNSSPLIVKAILTNRQKRNPITKQKNKILAQIRFCTFHKAGKKLIMHQALKRIFRARVLKLSHNMC